MADTFAGLAEHLRKSKLNLLATCKQMLAVLTGEGGQQTIFRPETQRSWHATLLARRVCRSIPDATVRPLERFMRFYRRNAVTRVNPGGAAWDHALPLAAAATDSGRQPGA